MDNAIEGIDELQKTLDGLVEKAQKASQAIDASDGKEDPIQAIRDDLLLPQRPRKIPLIEADSEEEAKKQIDEAGGEESFIETEWLGEDLEDYLNG